MQFSVGDKGWVKDNSPCFMLATCTACYDNPMVAIAQVDKQTGSGARNAAMLTWLMSTASITMSKQGNSMSRWHGAKHVCFDKYKTSDGKCDECPGNNLNAHCWNGRRLRTASSSVTC